MALAAAELRFWQGLPIDALTPATRAIALDPELPEPYCVRALHFEEEGRDDEADAAVGQALRLDPESWEANSTAARLNFRKGDIAAAIPLLEKAMAADRRDHCSASMLVTCFLAGDDAAGMRRAAELTIGRAEWVLICDPANGSAFASAAQALAVLGERDRAKKWTRKALNVDPGNLAMRYGLAATAASVLTDESQALEIVEPFVEAMRFPPHLKMLETDPSWAPIRAGERFQVLRDRARRRIDAFAGSPVNC
jgi:adenylate cyclase